ncbi:putative nicotinamide N-methyase/GNAT superfamily N-acetyltransferase [Crossiella equi]|uniref:Nicotinamide N-methyase/GNAT superfamily N-acetyltransferase n=1 Tax=Crossiella equi TaxID=130796 RepID=A0ABS5AQZ9_9PSEU|nr:GNAT family N-acetyltransferase [Crossiella equi]MBP2478827.1 putative nicotinamide N-methyase/GNAT superfamily N-acetyltransferase [Crossiella equi]
MDAEAFVREHTTVRASGLVPEVQLHEAEDITALWELTGAAEPPFWAFPWAGGQAVARYVLDHPGLVAGRRVFDLACGSGLVAIAAARAGAAAVTACDVDPVALVATRLNAEVNGVALAPLVADVLSSTVDADVVLAGDVFYDQDMGSAVLPFLRRAAERGALVLVGDPRRPYLPKELFDRVARYDVPVPRSLEGVAVLPSSVWRPARVTAADLRLMQGLAQRVTAVRPDLVNSDAAYGELAWNWGRNRVARGERWRRRLWFDGDELVAWGWVTLGASAYLAHQVHPDHAGLLPEVITWFDEVATGRERTVLAQAADEAALSQWTAHGYEPDPAELGDNGSWTQLNERDLADLAAPVLPPGYRFRTAEDAGPDAAVQAHVAAWTPTTYDATSYEGVRRSPGYRADLHVLVEAPDGTMAASTILWLDEVNRTAEFEPVGTHPDHRRRHLGTAMLWHGMHLAREAGATHVTVPCLGAPGHPRARGLFHGVGFRPVSRDLPLVKR